MEHMDLISNTHLNLLETIFEKVCPMLKEKIRKFQEQQGRLQKSLIGSVTVTNE